MVTDFWGVVIPNWIAATGGLLGAGLALVSLIVALRARVKAADAVAADAETREAVAIIAKPAAVTGTGSVTLPPLSAGGEGATTTPMPTEAEAPAPPSRMTGTRTLEEQKHLDGLVRQWIDEARRQRPGDHWFDLD